MADQLQTYPITCAGGLDLSRDVLSQGANRAGSAIQLINYEPAVTGGYRRVNGFLNSYGTLPGVGRTLGVVVADSIKDGILGCRENGTPGGSYLYAWNSTTTTWDSVTTPTLSSTAPNKVRFSKMDISATKQVTMSDGVNPAATYDGTTYTQITHANAPTTPKYNTAFQNHLFLAGDSANPTKLFFSAPLAPTDFAAANGAGVINVGFDIVAIKQFRDYLYVFGTHTIKRLSGNSSANFVLEGVTEALGCLASDSVVEISGDLLFLSQDGIRPISGTSRIGDVELETISRNIQPVFLGLPQSVDLDGMTSVVVHGKSQFRMFFREDETQGILGGLRAGEQGLHFEFATLLGWNVSAAATGYIGRIEHVIHGDSNGKVHRQELGYSFDGADVLSVYQSPFIFMENPETRKIIHKASTYMRSEGATEITMGVEYDYGNNTIFNPTNYELSTLGAAAYYNEATFDSTAIFDGNPSPAQTTNLSGSGKSVSFKYVTLGTKASHSIQGIVVTYETAEMR